MARDDMEYVEVRVTMRVPRSATRNDVEEYVEEAVRAWCGSKDPHDVMFDLDRKSVVAKMETAE